MNISDVIRQARTNCTTYAEFLSNVAKALREEHWIALPFQKRDICAKDQYKTIEAEELPLNGLDEMGSTAWSKHIERNRQSLLAAGVYVGQGAIYQKGNLWAVQYYSAGVAPLCAPFLGDTMRIVAQYFDPNEYQCYLLLEDMEMTVQIGDAAI